MMDDSDVSGSLCWHAGQITRLNFLSYPKIMGAYVPFKPSEVEAYDSFDNYVDWTKEKLIVSPWDDGAAPNTDPDWSEDCLLNGAPRAPWLGGRPRRPLGGGE